MVDHEDAEYDSIKSFLTETWKSITEPEAPRLTLVFQWSPRIEVDPSDFTDNLLDACNYKMLITIQGKELEELITVTCVYKGN